MKRKNMRNREGFCKTKTIKKNTIKEKTESAFTIIYCLKCAESFFVYLFTYIRKKIIIYKYKIDVIENSSHRIHRLKL